MAASIESRVPFLDHEFVEFSTRVPSHMKLRDGEGKYIVKKAIEGLVPNEIIYRKKMGFPTPLRKWLHDPRAARLFKIIRARDGLLASYIDPAALDNLLHFQVSGREDATDRIWRLLTLQLWGDVFLTGKREDRWDDVIASARPGYEDPMGQLQYHPSPPPRADRPQTSGHFRLDLPSESAHPGESPAAP